MLWPAVMTALAGASVTVVAVPTVSVIGASPVITPSVTYSVPLPTAVPAVQVAVTWPLTSVVAVEGVTLPRSGEDRLKVTTTPDIGLPVTIAVTVAVCPLLAISGLGATCTVMPERSALTVGAVLKKRNTPPTASDAKINATTNRSLAMVLMGTF